MKIFVKRSFLFLFVIVLSGLSLSGASLNIGQEQTRVSSFNRDPFYDAGCTVVYAADEEHAFGGNNEDSPDPFTMVWFLPAENGDYGRVLFGYENYVWQGGMNDQGLFFDAMTGDEMVRVPQGDKKTYPGSLPGKALASCADVPCVIELFKEYHAYDDWIFQFMFGDALGNSVIIEPNLFLEGGAPFQVATNFYQSRTDLYTCYFCTRYWKARNLFEKNEPLSVELIRDIMDAVHLEDEYPTQYTTVYDLKGGLIYLYHFHNYDEVVVFDLEEELAKGYHALSLPDLFPLNNDFLFWAQPEFARIVEMRSAYTPVEVDPALFEPYLGDYLAPERLNAMYSYYSIDYLNGELVLKMLPDKAWLPLEPSSESTFFHASGMSEFEITFLADADGEVNSFVYEYLGQEYYFERINVVETEESSQTPQDEPGEPSWLDQTTQGFGKILRSDTVKFLGIVLGLIMLQAFLGYLRSLLV